MSSARDQVFAAIRARLGPAEGRSIAPPRPGPSPCTPSGLDTPVARLAGFTEKLEGVGGHVHRVTDEDGAARALERIVADLDARDLALSDAPLARILARRLQGMTTFDGWSDRERLIDCDLGITTAQFGIAETGTLVLLSDDEKHRLTSLVPPVHVALLEAQDILATLGDGLQAARAGEGSPPPLVTLITGPSRTADIELTLVVGVHGPKEIHVILLDRDRPPTSTWAR